MNAAGKPTETAYAERINRVLTYVCQHLDEDLTLEQLSLIAGFSKFHFHRLFSAATGFTVFDYIRKTRLKRASYQLAFAPDHKVIEVALGSGFSSPEAFSRSFKDAYGQTPTEFRTAPRWGQFKRALPSPKRNDQMQPTIKNLESIPVAVLEHKGAPHTLMSSVSAFIAWRKSCRDSPEASSRTLGISYGDPAQLEDPAEFRFDICGELQGSLTPNDAGIIEKSIPKGRYAVARHVGSTDAIGDTVHSLYGQWLPESGEGLGEFPCFFHYVKRMPTVKEHEQETDVYLLLA